MHSFFSGARRSQKLPDFTKIELEFLERIAKVLDAGEVKYGRDNWKKGGEDFINDIPNHIIRHALLAANGNTSEDHMANIACNAMFYMALKSQPPKE